MKTISPPRTPNSPRRIKRIGFAVFKPCFRFGFLSVIGDLGGEK
jgi:hypothetical protein